MQNTLKSLGLFIICLVLATCGTSSTNIGIEDDYLSQLDLSELVWEYSLSNPDGFTVELPSLEPVTSGLAVGYYIGQENIGKESLGEVISHALANDNVIGGWLDTQDDTYYFDSICIFEDDEHQQATQFAIENNQRAYYDLSNEQTIYVGAE